MQSVIARKQSRTEDKGYLSSFGFGVRLTFFLFYFKYTDSRSADQKSPLLLRSPKLHYSAHQTSNLAPGVSSQIIVLHHFTCSEDYAFQYVNNKIVIPYT